MEHNVNKNTAATPWWVNGFFGLHYDLHARATDTELGATLTPEHLRTELEKVGPDFVQCDCKGHPGYTSYPTKVGSPSPGIVNDALRIHRDVTADLGIPLSVHYSGVWDTRAVELHPEWGAMNADGKPVIPRPGRPPGIVCRLSPYLDELMIPQLLEIVDEYDVDGFWVDGDNWAVRDCYCARCRKEFARRTGIEQPPTDPSHSDFPAWRAFQRDTFVEYVRKYADAVHKRKPSCAVCSNWMYTIRQPGPVTAPVDYLSGDFTSSFGCERAEMEGRYIDSRRMPWNLMAWTFCRAAPDMPAQTKTVPHLCQEAAEVMSCGGSVFLYDQPQRGGRLNSWHQDIFAEVGQFCRDRQPYCQFTESIPDAAVLVADPHVWRHNPYPFCLGESYYGFEGALHALIENHRHVDVLDETRLTDRLSDYSLVVVAEQDPVSAELLERLEQYVADGGVLLMTGAHLADLCPDLLGIVAAGDAVAGPWHIPHDGECISLKGPWRPVNLAGAESLAPVMRNQQPGFNETAFAAVTAHRIGRGQVIGIHGTIMESYLLSHHPRIRTFIRHLLTSRDISGRLDVSAPPSLEISMRQGKDFTAIHLVNRAVHPTLTPRLHIVEEVPSTGPVSIDLEWNQRPDSVTLEPEGRAVAWTHADGRLHVDIPSVAIHDIVVIA
ncbi:MAG: hypothetical protein K9N51_07890 [Candidatus Pacebacteria bacterium]|nr:hypothetical protein [Candidatus Paceibacterota bacterium]